MTYKCFGCRQNNDAHDEYCKYATHVIQKDDWIRVRDRLPKDDTRVDCRYIGVYELRKNILFWKDGVNNHFGGFAEIDGKGSQPATHWRPTT